MGCGFCGAALPNIVATLVVDCVVKPVGRQLDYVRHFQDNVEKLREKKRELADARDRLLHKIEDAKNRLLLIENDVQNLQSRADETLSDMGTLEEEIQLNKRCLNWCPNCSWRYQLSKKAKKKIQDISKLLERFGRLGPVGYRDPTALPTIDFLCSKEFVVSESSKAAFKQIIEALKDENINMIGLWGMGGVGKTTLVHEVGSQAPKLNLFGKVVITTVSQKPNFERIQDQIAQYIGFDMKNEQGRRSEQELWLRLKNEPRILIILDDIWESINLKEKIGIPIGDDHKGCKVLLTTRRQQVCRAMDCQNVVKLDCLDDDEAWTLFEKKAGLNVSPNNDIKILAKQIIENFGGLPIAIVPLGSALKGKSYHEWQVAYRRLKDRRLTEIEDVNEENAYVCLEASFDYLKNMETKTCFLLCSLFPEDDEIYMEDLVGYAWGLELYKGMKSIKEVRSEVLASIETLKNSGLLLDCGERHIKMHDVVRQFALWIASSRKEISFGTVETLPMDEMVFPNLKFLLHGGDCFMKTSSEFFEGMKALQVCALNNQLISLAAFQFHMNLRTLYLINCELSDISMLGKLKTLHILSLSRSDIIELPTEAGDLENLRLLDLSCCNDLRRIAANLIRRLSNLEELYLHGCSSLKWATENSTKRESYYSLSELNLLPKLVVISLDFSSKHLPDSFVFRRLWSFDFCIGIKRNTWFQKRETYPISRSLRISDSVDACKQLFEDVESLELNEVEGHPNLIPSLDLGFSKLTSLDLRWCHSIRCLIDASKQQVPITTLSNLRKLSLSGMFHLEEMCNAPQPQGFLQKLEEVIVSYCDAMQLLFPIAELIANSLGQLHTLKIKSCWSLEGIIQDSQVPYISLQSLRESEVEECNNLKYLFPMFVANTLEQLHTLKIKSCSQLEDVIQDPQVTYIYLLQSLREESEQDQTTSQYHPLPNCFPNLILIDIFECKSLKSLFPIIVAQGSSKKLIAPNLQTLKIERCFGIEEIIQDSQVSTISFQSLRELQVTEYNKLKFLFPMCVANSLGKLQTLKIERCFGMEEIIQDSQVSIISFQCLMEVQALEFSEMTEKKQISNVTVPERRGGTSTSTQYLTISNFEELFEYSGYNLSTLTILHLSKLTELRVIWSGLIQVEYFQNLAHLTVKDCRRLRYIFSSTIARNLPHLGKLDISNCEELEQIIEKDQTPSQHHLQPICFPILSLITIEMCENLKCLFPITLAHGGLPNLEQLDLIRLSKLEQVFEGDELNVSKDEEKVIHLPELTDLVLDNLPNLVSFSPVDYHFVFPSLTDLRVEGCPNVTTRFSFDSKESVHAKTQVHYSSKLNTKL
ncbi:hypothetical protein V6Z12_A04G048400 [Gossypium hirsutum]